MLFGIKRYQFVRNDDVRRLTKQPKLTAIIHSRQLTLFLAYYVHGRQCRCQEDLVSLPSGRLEKTTRSSPHHVAQHHSTGSETTPPYTPRSSRIGSEPPSVEDDVDVWRYAILELRSRNDDNNVIIHLVSPVISYLALVLKLCTLQRDVFNAFCRVSCMFIYLVGKPYCKELLLASVSEGRLQILRSILRISQSQADIWCWDSRPAESCTVIRLQSSSICWPQYPFIWVN